MNKINNLHCVLDPKLKFWSSHFIRSAIYCDAFAATATEGVFVYALETAGLGSSLLGGVQNWLFDASAADEET
ncbi:unnamed protein product, partial [Dibothriocephalus latus]